MKEWIRDIIIAVVVALIVIQFVKPTIVREKSMQPTLYNNDYIFLSKQAYLFSEPKAGDIVVFHSDLTTDKGKEKLLIKRIIALPGQTIKITEGEVYIDGEIQQEDYIMEQFTRGDTEITVPEGYVFAMGDNRQNSNDSRDNNVGCIDIEDIVGKAVFRLYPFNAIGTLH